MLRLPSFDYFQPATTEEVAAILHAEAPACAVVSGGTDLFPKMKRRQLAPRTLISLRRLGALHRVAGEPEEGIVIGARVTLAELERNPMLCSRYPAVAAAARAISSPPLRNAGTIGGNLCVDTRCTYYDQTYEWRKAIDFCMKKDGHVCWVAPSSPRCWAVASSDLAPVMIALGAKVRLLSKQGDRLIPAAELYRNDGIEFLSKRPDELLTEIHLPAVSTDLMVYKKLRRRGAIDFPILGVAIWLRPSAAERSVIEQGRIAITAVASYPFEVEAARKLFRGARLNCEVIEQAAEAAWKRAKPLDNTDLDMSWRKEMVRVFTRRALQELSDNLCG
ncbi:MAG TPA: FAD binding domain-containing protein [Acidobacteriota bacterium]|jgi:4-hydroxybenzoyl-CoA reductase subunit beta